MPLSKTITQRHQNALAHLDHDELTLHQRWQMFEDFHEGADSGTWLMGAHVTSLALANDLLLNIDRGPILDLCAGIGTLAFSDMHRRYHDTMPSITCLELNPQFVAVGKKILPEATWICGNLIDPAIQVHLREQGFTTVIGD